MNAMAGTLPHPWLAWSIDAGLLLLLAALLAALWRAARGPGPYDRLVALKLAWLSAIGVISALMLETRSWHALDLALVLALLGSIVPFASTYLARRRAAEQSETHDADAH
jgi:multisubunit Na+/H+ antiporter MnhF subunit